MNSKNGVSRRGPTDIEDARDKKRVIKDILRGEKIQQNCKRLATSKEGTSWGVNRRRKEVTVVKSRSQQKSEKNPNPIGST